MRHRPQLLPQVRQLRLRRGRAAGVHGGERRRGAAARWQQAVAAGGGSAARQAARAPGGMLWRRPAAAAPHGCAAQPSARSHHPIISHFASLSPHSPPPRHTQVHRHPHRPALPGGGVPPGGDQPAAVPPARHHLRGAHLRGCRVHARPRDRHAPRPGPGGAHRAHAAHAALRQVRRAEQGAHALRSCCARAVPATCWRQPPAGCPASAAAAVRGRRAAPRAAGACWLGAARPSWPSWASARWILAATSSCG